MGKKQTWHLREVFFGKLRSRTFGRTPSDASSPLVSPCPALLVCNTQRHSWTPPSSRPRLVHQYCPARRSTLILPPLPAIHRRESQSPELRRCELQLESAPNLHACA